VGVIAQLCLGSATTGFPILASGPVNWQLKTGVLPVMAEFHLTPDAHQQILKYSSKPGNSVSLFLQTGNRNAHFKQLFVVGSSPGPNKYIKAVTVSDRRFFWSYCHIGPRRYNWRRVGGVKRLETPGVEANLGDPLADTIYYTYNSMFHYQKEGKDYFSGRAWEPDEVIQNIFRDVFEYEKDQCKLQKSPAVPGVPYSGNIPIENLLIDSPGDQAIARALAYLPELEVYINKNGDARIKQKNDGKEIQVAGSKLGAEKIDRGHISMVKNQLLRPGKIHVQFERECEVRFDYWDFGSSASQSNEGRNEADFDLASLRRLTNVCQESDFLGAQFNTAMGTWRSIPLAIFYWNETSKPKGVKLAFTDQVIRRAFVPFMDLWASYLQLGQYDPDNDWMGRISQIQQHYRQTFQIAPAWNEASYNLKASRVAILDPVTGVQSPALVLANHTRLGSQKSFRMNKLNNEALEYAMPIFSYPATDPEAPDKWEIDGVEPCIKYPIVEDFTPRGRKTKKTVHAPIQLTVLDQDQGIVHFNFLPDVTRNYEQMLPSLLTLKTGKAYGDKPRRSPGGNPTQRGIPITFDMMGNSSFNRQPELSVNHKALIIVTLSPSGWSGQGGKSSGGPGGKGYENKQLETITIDPNGEMGGRLKEKVSKECRKSIQSGSGPDMYVRIGAGIEVARIAWKDNEYEMTERIFGFREGEIDTENLCINKDKSIEGASLNEIALGTAARIYESLTDRFQGDKTSTLSGDTEPLGWIDSVDFTVNATGEVSTRIDLPESIPQMDLMSFLDSSTRAVILKLSSEHTLK
tara:strand:- start:278 stop:2686 length:2409 start_codon:yes stop_codon:yes gene_type:complete